LGKEWGRSGAGVDGEWRMSGEDRGYGGGIYRVSGEYLWGIYV